MSAPFFRGGGVLGKTTAKGGGDGGCGAAEGKLLAAFVPPAEGARGVPPFPTQLHSGQILP